MALFVAERLYFAMALFVTFVAVGRIFLVVNRRRVSGSTSDPIAQVADPGKPTLVYFWTATCGQCKPQEREIEAAKAALQKAGRLLAVHKVNAFDDPELVKSMHVFTVPTTVLLDAHGKVAAWNPGFAPARKILEQIRQAA